MEPAASASAYLSQDLVNQILSKLPAQPLIRLSVVCRSWRSIIFSPEFLSLHLRHNRHKASQIVLCDESYTKKKRGKLQLYERYWLLDDDQHHSLRPLNCPFKYPPNLTSHKIVSTINGLICITGWGEFSGNSLLSLPIILWNPSVRRHVVLPDFPPLEEGKQAADYTSVEFGYEATTDDYKVVAMRSGSDIRGHLAAHVYSLNSNTWRRVDVGPSMRTGGGNRRLYCTGAFVRGKIHWLVTRDYEMKVGHSFWCLYSFDVKEEVFEKMALPPEDPTRNKHTYFPHVTVVDDSLCVIDSPTLPSTIWMLKKEGSATSYSWTKLYSLDPIAENMTAKLVVYLKNGEFLLDTYCIDDMVGMDLVCIFQVYEPGTRRCTVLHTRSNQNDHVALALVNHHESLVLLDRRIRAVSAEDPRTSRERVQIQRSCWSSEVLITKDTTKLEK
ncbi:Unknown protein [Striga hermonthica]|uniref:F-box domain-containing protein n=1 Tax=Striga hermonthica TaxID=68872 RepID=A0A9N7R8U1_STRHE|nr:Unknown protein [Striga hermonthica]